MLEIAGGIVLGGFLLALMTEPLFWKALAWVAGLGAIGFIGLLLIGLAGAG